MPKVTDIIEQLGGVRKTAATLGVPPTTVQNWKRQNRVPSWREADLFAAYGRLASKAQVAA